MRVPELGLTTVWCDEWLHEICVSVSSERFAGETSLARRLQSIECRFRSDQGLPAESCVVRLTAVASDFDRFEREPEPWTVGPVVVRCWPASVDDRIQLNTIPMFSVRLTNEFLEWLDALKDKKAQIRVVARLRLAGSGVPR
jgi:hypothetical protein